MVFVKQGSCNCDLQKPNGTLMAVIPNQMNVVVTWPVESSPIKKVNSSQLILESWESRQSLFFHVSHTFWVYLLSDLVLLQIPLCIPHLVNYCSLLSSNPPPPFHSVTVDTWHLETTCASPTKCWQSGDHQWRWKNRLAYSGLLCTTERWGTHWFLWVVFFYDNVFDYTLAESPKEHTTLLLHK